MKNITIKILDENYECDTINKENLETYLSAKEQVELMNAAVVTPFEQGLKADIEYNKDNIPDKTQKIIKFIGGQGFEINAVPTNKPSYGAVFDQIAVYLRNLELGSKKRKNRYGVRTIKNKAYACIDDTLNVFKDYLKQSEQPSVDIKIDKSYLKKGIGAKINALNINVDEDYSKLNRNNAILYKIVANQIWNLKKRVINPFQNAVKQEIGYDKENIPEKVAYNKEVVGDVLMFTTSSKADNIKYAPVVKGMIDYLKNEDKLVPPDTRSDFEWIQKFNNKNYLSIGMMKKQFNYLKAQNTEETLRQITKYLRLPKNEKVVV